MKIINQAKCYTPPGRMNSTLLLGHRQDVCVLNCRQSSSPQSRLNDGTLFGTEGKVALRVFPALRVHRDAVHQFKAYSHWPQPPALPQRLTSGVPWWSVSWELQSNTTLDVQYLCGAETPPPQSSDQQPRSRWKGRMKTLLFHKYNNKVSIHCAFICNFMSSALFTSQQQHYTSNKLFTFSVVQRLILCSCRVLGLQVEKQL